ncbi:helix-turn-helix domain-containing protein [Yersinia enterocolitica]|nr:helix-turn-helix transcriptional regulator [Yersinia enterocolitica]HDM8329164.1 helix-turn-helix transcriptional regulator [Yersinia enterocolitica]HDM8368185.1 helix-turn-helix transcriptional regulator [Yersinia enterocolitica]
MVDDTSKPVCTPERLSEIRVVLEQVANKWSIMILTMLCDGPVRFNDLRRRLGDITHKSLTEALRRLERYKLISRRVLCTSPVAVEYEITELGKTLEMPVHALVRWAEDHANEMLNS